MKLAERTVTILDIPMSGSECLAVVACSAVAIFAVVAATLWLLRPLLRGAVGMWGMHG